jgi:uncharacterized protein involved in oxidation of intracellular sulfur
MQFLFILNDSPYGSQRTYNALRLALNLSRSELNSIRIFLMGDGVTAALSACSPAHSDYNTQEMLAHLGERGVAISACKTCLEARGLTNQHMLSCVVRSTLDELTQWTEDTDKVLAF